jgi:hypothetical protein
LRACSAAIQVRNSNPVPDIEQSLKQVIAMDWERLIPGHPGPGGRQTGAKDEARNQLAYLRYYDFWNRGI